MKLGAAVKGSNMFLRLSGLTLCAASLFFVGCGKKGPMLYPDLLVAQPPGQVQVEQADTALRITFTLPEHDKAGRPLHDLESIHIERRVCTQADCKDCLEPFQELQRIDLTYPEAAERAGNRVSWTDTGVRQGEVVQYRLISEQKGKIKGGTAQSVPAYLAAALLPPVCTGKTIFGGTIELRCVATDSGDFRVFGYLLYRAEGSGPMRFVARIEPVNGAYVDQSVLRGVVYRYAAKQQVRREDGSLQESAFSVPLSLSLGDE